MVTDLLERKILVYAKAHKLFRLGDKVLVGVSGGPDSSVLLNILYALRSALGVDLVVAHYDHALRRSSAKDAQNVKRCAERLGLKCITDKCRLSPPKKGSLEEFARDQRYSFLFKTARHERIQTIAVAHTQDDQAETVLMRILRGAGTTGIRSMLPSMERDGLRIIRPMLETTRTEVEAYVSRHCLKVTHDPTNRSQAFFRNHLRLKTIPLLEKDCAPDIRLRLSTLAKIAAIDQDYIDGQAIKAYSGLCHQGKRRRGLRLDRFCRLHSALRRAIIRLALTDLGGKNISVGFEHIEALEKMALASKTEIRMDLPGGLHARKSRILLEIFF